jgi:hypothetical protein
VTLLFKDDRLTRITNCEVRHAEEQEQEEEICVRSRADA